MSVVSLFGNGFIGSNYVKMFGDTVVEPRNAVSPSSPDVLYTISTTHNYWPLKGDLHKDVDTNLTHLMNVLPNVTGTFCFLSSWFVCASAGSSPDHPAKESDLCQPTGFYSITKLAAEQLIQSYCAMARNGLVKGPSDYKILRLCNVIGKDPNAGKQKNALEYMLSKIVVGENIQIYEGDNYRNFLHVEDVCRAIRLCLDKGPKDSVIHIGAKQSFRIEDIARYAIAKVRSAAQIERVPIPAFHKIVQAPNFWMNTDQLYGLGFRPSYNIWEAIDKIL